MNTNTKSNTFKNIHLAQARLADQYQPFERMLEITGDIKKDASIIEEMNKEGIFLNMAMFNAVNCLEYFARYKDRIMYFDALVEILIMSNPTPQMSSEEQFCRFMRAYNLNENSIIRAKNTFDLPLFYLVAGSSRHESVTNMLLDKNPNLDTPVMMENKVFASNLDEWLTILSQESIRSQEVVSQTRRLMEQRKVKQEKDYINQHIRASKNRVTKKGVHKV